MSRTGVLILLGVLSILNPFSGLPIAFRNLLAVVFGACIFGIGLSLRTREVEALTPVAPETPDTSAPPVISAI
jgi:hypothetical protein